MRKEKINWKKEYMYDNFFNIIMTLISLGVIVYELSLNEGESVIAFLLLIIPIQFFVNLSASRFFVDKHKYE